MNTTSVRLTDLELLLLDGRCRPKIQREVDTARLRVDDANALGDIPDDLRPFVVRVMEEARTNGELTFIRERIRHCDVCGKDAGYAKYTRTSQYHRKGELNYKRPLYLPGIELARRFVVIEGHTTVGCCAECWERAKPHVAQALTEIPAEIPAEVTGHEPRYRKYRHRRCKECGWEGHEGQMGRLRTMMGDGYYPGVCPQCGAKNLPLGGTKVETTDGFTVVEVKKDD